jgi:hypothetical protein
MFYTVYKITNSLNGKVYIGAHRTNNLKDDYMGSGCLIKKAVIKYGAESFVKEYLAIFDNEFDMFNMESELVGKDFVESKDTYNLTLGGSGGWGFYKIPENKELRVRKNRRARESTDKILKDKYGDDWRSVLGKKGRGAWTKETYAKAHNSRVKNNGEDVYKTFQGKKHTDEARKKIGEANKVHQLGKGNSQYGTIWIYNIEIKKSKKIKKEELSNWLAKGWIAGRKIKFGQIKRRGNAICKYLFDKKGTE